MFNLLDYLYICSSCLALPPRALKSLILGGIIVALHGGTAYLYWVRQLLLIPLGMTCDIDFVFEASLSCLTAEVVLNIYHILNYVYIYI